MGVSIENADAERNLRKVARLLGKSMTATVLELAGAKLKEIEAQKDRARRLRKIDEIVRLIKSLPVLREGTDEELIGYNNDGLFD